MEIKKLEKENLNDILEILSQDTLRFADGGNPDPNWVTEFINNKEKCFALGIFEENILISILLAERLVYKGCILWYIATDPNRRSLGYGGKLLESFEELVKKEGLKWIFLNATEDSLNFYKKHGFLTSQYSKVYEHVKDF